VLRVRTDEGVDGVALVPRRGSAAVVADAVERILRDELIGADPLQREWLWHRIWELDRTEELSLDLLAVVDTALWDLAGRFYGAPVWELLGGFRREIAAYASTSTFDTLETYLEVATQCLELGYPAIKLHAWGDARRDAKLCTAVREHVGDDVPLMYDGSAAFDLADAVYVGDALSDSGYLWYEEPIREFSITAYKWLAERVRVPLNVAETSDGAHMNTADFIASGCATFVRVSRELKGGFTGAMRIAHLADSFRLRAEPHGPTIYSRHLCMAIPNCTYYESLVTTNPARREAGISPSGMVAAPVGPGVGLQSGFEYPPELEQYVVDLDDVRLSGHDEARAT
jgi:L-alanine-DL-glutamate epimerase-like enolase superfamily enzyme